MAINRQQLQATLQTVKANKEVQVAFVLDPAGTLVAWAGKCAGFSPMGQFPAVDESNSEVNLYLTTVGAYYVGVLFENDRAVDTVRGAVESQGARFVSSLGVRPGESP